MNEGSLALDFASDGTTKSPSEQVSDLGLVRMFRLGNNDAFAVLIQRHRRRLQRTALRITRNKEDSEDAVQEAFLKAYWRIDTFREESSFSTWITKILINTCLMKLRQDRSRLCISLDEENESGSAWIDYIPDQSVDIEATYAMQERSELLARAILQLRPALRSVVRDYQQHDYTMLDLAERNGISIAAVKSRMLRARAALKRSSLISSAR